MEKNLSVLQITLVTLPGSQEEPWALAVVYGMSLWTAAEESRRRKSVLGKEEYVFTLS